MDSLHQIQLCQPDSRKSCSACCGLYNWNDHSRTAVEDSIALQTDLFFSLNSFDDFTEYRRRRDAGIHNHKLFDTIYNCEFVGFIDAARHRVGCMLHPAVTGRHDLRNNCFYGEKICNSHFCPSFSCLTLAEQQAIVNALDDWYLYGLVITDIDFVKFSFKYIEDTIGESLKPQRLQNRDCIAALRGLLQLKECWKFKSQVNRLGKYYFSKAEYTIARIEYKKLWGVPPSRFDKILVSLESELRTHSDVLEAEALIEDKMQAIINAYAA